MKNIVILKKLFSYKILTIIIILNFFLAIFIAFKFLKNDDYFSNFYLNFLVYSMLFLVINLIIQLQRSQITKTYYVICILSLFTGFYLTEIYLTFKGNPLNAIEDLNFRKQKALKIGKEFDDRTKYEVFHTLEKQGFSVAPTIPPNDILTKEKYKKFSSQIFALSNISKIYNVFCNESGKRIIYLSDRYGFRNDDEIWDQNVDIAILGDSIVQGACVDEKDVSANVLSKITDKKVLNLGIQGHGPLMQLGTLKEYAIHKKPKIVLWYYFEANDFSNMIEEMKNKTLLNYKNRDFTQELILRHDKINIQLKEIINQFRSDGLSTNKIRKKDNKVKIVNIIKLNNLRNLLNSYLPNDKALVKYRYHPTNLMDDYFDILEYANKVVKSWGGELYFVYHPDYSRYIGFNSLKYSERKYGSFIKRLKKNEIKIIDLKTDLYDKLANVRDIYHFGLHGHPNELGYSLSAEVLKQRLILN